MLNHTQSINQFSPDKVQHNIYVSLHDFSVHAEIWERLAMSVSGLSYGVDVKHTR